jgi:hypothetical protein
MHPKSDPCAPHRQEVESLEPVVAAALEAYEYHRDRKPALSADALAMHKEAAAKLREAKDRLERCERQHPESRRSRERLEARERHRSFFEVSLGMTLAVLVLGIVALIVGYLAMTAPSTGWVPTRQVGATVRGTGLGTALQARIFGAAAFIGGAFFAGAALWDLYRRFRLR